MLEARERREFKLIVRISRAQRACYPGSNSRTLQGPRWRTLRTAVSVQGIHSSVGERTLIADEPHPRPYQVVRLYQRLQKSR